MRQRGGTVIYAPACFLKFADKKLTNEAVKNGIITSGYIALDVLTIVKGVPAFSAIRAATLAGEISKELAAVKYAYKLLEIGNAIGNIKLNLTSPQLQDTTFREVVEASNYLLLALNAKEIAKGAANGLYAVYGVTKQALQNGKSLIKKQILARFVAAIIDNEAKLYALRRQANLDSQVARELDQLAAVKQAVEKEAKVAYGEAEWQEAVNSARKGVSGAGSVFKTITTDVATALNNRISHIRKIVFEVKSNGTYKFSGCHSKSAIDELGANARIEVTIPANAEGVYEAKVFVKGPDGIEIPKSGNQGKSTFFPDSWSEAKILEEAEHAVKNNKGFANGVDDTEGYYGFSKDGKIKIQFYYRDSDGFIGSFFPKLD